MNSEILNAKKTVVKEIEDLYKDAGSMVICEYRGLSVEKLTELRRNLAKVDATLTVYKNSLFTRATENVGHKDLLPYLTGSNAYVFCKDPTAAPSALAKFAKKNEFLVLKAGLIDGTVMDADGVKEIAKLPGRDGLYSMFLSCLQAPIRNLAYALKSVADSKN